MSTQISAIAMVPSDVESAVEDLYYDAEESYLDNRFAELQKVIAEQERPQDSIPKIQRVPKNLRDRKDFAKYYSPKLMSFGPIHHGDENLQLGEQYKLLWAAKYIQSTKQTPQILHKKIADKIKNLGEQFEGDVLRDFFAESSNIKRGWERMSWMLFVDGCALLQIMMKGSLDHLLEMGVNFDILSLAKQDALLLENQVPYLVLKLLWTRNESELIRTMMNICFPYNCGKSTGNVYDMNCEVVAIWVEPEDLAVAPVHLLDLQRRILLADRGYRHPKDTENNSRENSSDVMVTFRNIHELKATGIRLKSSKTRRPRDISFSNGWLVGELTLPEIVVDNTTPATFQNLIAYEMCPDFENDYGICSFAAFMDSLIDNPEDVKALRSAGILLNSLGRDEEVANLFNILSSDLVPDTQAYYEVRAKIEKYCKTKWKTWIALGYHTYFSNPWSIIAFFAALLALVLTFIQTWFTIHPVS